MTNEDHERIIELKWFAQGMELAMEMIYKDMFAIAHEILSVLAETAKGKTTTDRRRIAWSTTSDYLNSLATLWAAGDKGVQNGEKPVS
jgi:hypothetical protein